MNKRHFLTTATVAATTGLMTLRPAMAANHGTQRPALLTVTGAVRQGNREAFDPVRDQMMGKHGVKFDKAFAFDTVSLHRLPAHTIKPTLEYDNKAHTLSGPLLTAVLEAAGADMGPGVQLALRAVDGYNVSLSLAEVSASRMLVATHLDGRPMALGGLGPQWAVWDGDRLPQFKDKPVSERFAQCPWGLYLIEVNKA